MKSVMQQFHDRTKQRFQEYDEKLQEKRQIYKDKCDKEIEKIILKDKLEKQMAQQLTTLETKIDTNDIPTCICEKSIADKVEKACLRCAQNLGGIVAPSLGVLGGIAEGALYAWKPKAIETTIAAALKANSANITIAAKAAGIQAGKEAVIEGLKKMGVSILDNQSLVSYFATTPYKDVASIAQAVYEQYFNTCADNSLWSVRFPSSAAKHDFLFCQSVSNQIPSVSQPGQHISHDEVIKRTVETMMSEAEGTANAAAEIARESATNAIKAREAEVINTIFMSKQTAIIASIVAIVVIVLIMIIIYLILRYRRKKKMKKKLQYIKLLEE
ncbi:surface antigen [Plasmodium falciparum UGT5.1]|uniref:Surface antigen n=1 Tax=Plasmodium falciparum UGT5.1 TaxID=1237627 RepID=W7JGG3_PLAFA|nr:surface antigen [Plasmodium falciparum UGT5.1]